MPQAAPGDTITAIIASATAAYLRGHTEVLDLAGKAHAVAARARARRDLWQLSIPCPGAWNPAALAALTARLSGQPVSWDGRVVYATPLHLAASADEADLADEDAEDSWTDSPDQELPEPDR